MVNLKKLNLFVLGVLFLFQFLRFIGDDGIYNGFEKRIVPHFRGLKELPEYYCFLFLTPIGLFLGFSHWAMS